MVTWKIKNVSPQSRAPRPQNGWWWGGSTEKVTWHFEPQGLWLANLAGYWLFCGYYDRVLRRRNLTDPSIALFLSFFFKNNILYQMLKKPSRCNWKTENLCLPKINTIMPTRTKSVEMNKIVSNSEIHLHHCLCKSRAFKFGRSSHRRRSIKKVFLKTLQNWQENHRVRHRFFPASFTKFLRTLFSQNTSGQLLLTGRFDDQKFSRWFFLIHNFIVFCSSNDYYFGVTKNTF